MEVFQNFSRLSKIFVVMSILISCLKTQSIFRCPNLLSGKNVSIPSNTINQQVLHRMVFLDQKQVSPLPSLFYADILCNVFITAEFLARFFACPNKQQFAKGFLNWAELIAIISIYVEAIWYDIFRESITLGLRSYIVFFI